MQVPNNESKVPGCQTLLDSQQFLSLIARARNDSLDALPKLKYVRYKPHTSCLVGYEVQFGGRREFWHAKAYRADDWSVRKKKLLTLNAKPNTEGACLVDELACAVFAFPVDAQLPALSRIHSVSSSIPFFSRLLKIDPSEQIESIEPLAYKPNRRFTGRLTTCAATKFVVKLYHAARFKAAKQSANALSKLGVGSPKKFGHSNRNRCMALEWIDGETLGTLMLEGRADDNHIERTIDALERLHATPLESCKRMRTRQPTFGIDKLAKYLAEICPASQERVRQLARSLFERDQRCPYLPTLIHGDLHPGQILRAGNAISFCDFDNACLGDPASDAGNWLGHVRYQEIMGEIPGYNCQKMLDVVSSVYERSFQSNRNASRFRLNYLFSLFRHLAAPFRAGREDWQLKTDEIIEEINESVSRWPGENFAVKTRRCETPGRRSPMPARRCRLIRSRLSVAVKNDERLGFIHAALVANSGRRLLKLSLPGIKQLMGNFEIHEIHFRRHKPGKRCLVEYVLDTEQGLESILGKVRAKGFDHHAFANQQQLYEHHGFQINSDDGISIPRPVGAIGEWNIWFQRRVSGRPSDDYLKTPVTESIFRKIARAIAKLHRCTYVPARRHTAVHEWKILKMRLDEVADELPAERPRLERILAHCCELTQNLNSKRLTCIHRDFYHDQVLVSRKRVHIVDLDLLTMGHPALDVGNFVAHLTDLSIRRSGRADLYTAAEHAFVTEYLQTNSNCTYEEISVCKTLTLARLISISRKIKDRCKYTLDLIEEVEQMMGSCDV